MKWFPSEAIIKKPKYTAFFEPWTKELISSADLLKYTSFFKSLSETALDTVQFTWNMPRSLGREARQLFASTDQEQVQLT